MMAMFLRCLMFVFGGHQLQRESALWWSRKERRGGKGAWTWYGLGFGNTLPRHGYCWLEPRFDWDRVRFRPQFTDEVLFGDNILHGQRLRHGVEPQIFFDSIQRLEMALNRLGQHTQTSSVRDCLVSWMAHICLQQFRVDVLHRAKRDIANDQRDGAVKGEHPFCMEHFQDIFVDKVYVMSGNRCEVKSVSTLAHLLFDFDDGLARTHWEYLPFRTLHRRAVLGARSLNVHAQHSPSEGLEEKFWRELWKSLLTYHRILPYPSHDAIMQRTKHGKRMWYSIIARKEDSADLDGHVEEMREGLNRREKRARAAKERMQRRREEYIDNLRWMWGRKSWQPGRPPSLPLWVAWDKEKWKEWIMKD